MEFLTKFSLQNTAGILSVTSVFLFIISYIYLVFSVKTRKKACLKGRTSAEEGVENKPIPPGEALNTLKARMHTQKLATLSHDMVMVGGVLFFLTFIIFMVQILLNGFFGILFLRGIPYTIFSYIRNITGTLVFTGITITILRRILVSRLDNSFRYFPPLILLFSAVLSGFMLDGMALTLTSAPWHSSFAAIPFALLFEGINITTGNMLLVVFMLMHILLLGLFFATLSKTHMFHIVFGFINIRSQIEDQPGRLKNSETQINNFYKTQFTGNGDSADDEAGESEEFGVKSVSNLTVNQLIQLDSCAECGRCNSVCPAYQSGKSLSPQKLIKSQKNKLTESQKKGDASIIDEANTRQAVWECSMCYSCEEACPSLVTHVDKIAGMRRYLTLEEGKAPDDIMKLINTIEKSENPYGVEKSKRDEFIKELGIPVLKKDETVDYVLWLGCHSYCDMSMKNIILKLTGVLKKAGKTFAVLADETCCGDHVRRLGAEHQFQELLYKNIEAINGIKPETILTVCPHCYNSLKKEYPTFGMNKKVIHYLEVLPEVNSAINAAESKKKKVFYHDSCYLGRLNSLKKIPRDVISTLGGSQYELVSLDDESVNSLCCGGGAGRFWVEERIENRASMVKVQQLKDKVDVIVTSCPYCKSLFQDASGTIEASIEVVDLLELID